MKPSIDAASLSEQLQAQRRTVDFDTYDILVQQLLSMLKSGTIDIAPAYQRQFRWKDPRCSQFIESLFLGIPIPSLFMAADRSGTSWELVDGVQRLSTLVKFAGDAELREKLGVGEPLRLIELEKLSLFNEHTFLELPETIQTQFNLRNMKSITLNDKSDEIVRFDLFERLNKGGVALTEQEIRNCVFRGRFSETLSELSDDQNFNKVVLLTDRQNRDGTREECVLRFFAFLHRYGDFVHSVKEFLNDYMREASKKFNYKENESLFRDTFLQLANLLPGGIVRPTRKNITPLILFEGVAVGAALAIKEISKLNRNGGVGWLGSAKLRKLTTGHTNDPAAVKGRIEYCRDKFLGKKDVEQPAD